MNDIATLVERYGQLRSDLGHTLESAAAFRVIMVAIDAQSEQKVQQIKQAIGDFYVALDARQHGGVAMSVALDKIERLLGMSWRQGEETKKRAANLG